MWPFKRKAKPADPRHAPDGLYGLHRVAVGIDGKGRPLFRRVPVVSTRLAARRWLAGEWDRYINKPNIAKRLRAQ